MVKFENVQIVGWDAAMRALNRSAETQSDSHWTHIEDTETLETAPYEFFMGENDHALAMARLSDPYSDTRFLRMITVFVDVTAPTLWWDSLIYDYDIQFQNSDFYPDGMPRTISTTYWDLLKVTLINKITPTDHEVLDPLNEFIGTLPYHELITGALREG